MHLVPEGRSRSSTSPSAACRRTARIQFRFKGSTSRCASRPRPRMHGESAVLRIARRRARPRPRASSASTRAARRARAASSSGRDGLVLVDRPDGSGQDARRCTRCSAPRHAEPQDRHARGSDIEERARRRDCRCSVDPEDRASTVAARRARDACARTRTSARAARSDGRETARRAARGGAHAAHRARRRCTRDGALETLARLAAGSSPSCSPTRCAASRAAPGAPHLRALQAPSRARRDPARAPRPRRDDRDVPRGRGLRRLPRAPATAAARRCSRSCSVTPGVRRRSSAARPPPTLASARRGEGPACAARARPAPCARAG